MVRARKYRQSRLPAWDTFKIPQGCAGLDKGGECIDALGAMGFWLPGNRHRDAAHSRANDKPRLFRLVD